MILMTCTLHDAVHPLLVVAVIVAQPSSTAVILPSDTVATLLSLVVHVIVLSVVFDGTKDTIIVSDWLVSRVIDVLSSVISNA